MNRNRWQPILWLAVLMGPQCVLQAQQPSRFQQRIRQQALNRFDENRDGKLSVSERKQAQAFLRERFADRDSERKQGEVEPLVDPETTPLYQLSDGPFRVSQQNLDLIRESETQKLPLKVTFPVVQSNADSPTISKPLDSNGSNEISQPTKFPVILFSHGAGGSRETYQPLTEYWASHGYVVIQPTHGDSLSLLSVRNRQQIRLKNYVLDGGIEKYLIPRTRDIKLILDQLQEIENSIPDLKIEFDKDKVGMGGHSYGAYTTMLIGNLSLTDTRTKRRASFADPRPIALLMMSPQGLGGAIDTESFANIKRPTMIVTGSQDDGVRGQPARWRLDAFTNLPATNKWLTFIEGAEHNFGGISGVNYLGSGEPNPDHVYYVKSSTLAFWDAQLKSDAVASDYLDSGKLQEVTRWVARISRTVDVLPPGK